MTIYQLILICFACYLVILAIAILKMAAVESKAVDSAIGFWETEKLVFQRSMPTTRVQASFRQLSGSFCPSFFFLPNNSSFLSHSGQSRG